MPKSLDSLSNGAKPAKTPATEAPAPSTAPEVKAEETLTPIAPVSPEPNKETASLATDSFESLFPEPTVAISGPPSWIWWVLLILASIGLGLVGYKLLNSKVDSWLSLSGTASPKASAAVTALPTISATSTPEPSSQPTVSPTASLSPTSTPTAGTPLAKSSVTLRVLNGTTTAGAASTVKSLLEKAGYTVKSIGNAHSQTYQSTVIYYQTGRLEEAKLVQTALNSYSATIEESTLASPDMILVVYGSK